MFHCLYLSVNGWKPHDRIGSTGKTVNMILNARKFQSTSTIPSRRCPWAKQLMKLCILSPLNLLPVHGSSSMQDFLFFRYYTNFDIFSSFFWQKNYPSQWNRRMIDAMTKDFSWDTECCDIHVSAYTTIKNL